MPLSDAKSSTACNSADAAPVPRPAFPTKNRATPRVSAAGRAFDRDTAVSALDRNMTDGNSVGMRDPGRLEPRIEQPLPAHVSRHHRIRVREVNLGEHRDKRVGIGFGSGANRHYRARAFLHKNILHEGRDIDLPRRWEGRYGAPHHHFAGSRAKRIARKLPAATQLPIVDCDQCLRVTRGEFRAPRKAIVGRQL